MKIKSREDALLHCFDLWLWLALNPDKVCGSKQLWPGWEERGGYLDYCYRNCPCCEFAPTDCNRCPIKWSYTGSKDYMCEYSEYRKWRNSKTLEDRTKWALEIAILALEALNPK